MGVIFVIDKSKVNTFFEMYHTSGPHAQDSDSAGLR